MDYAPGSKAFNGIDEYVWNHTFVITTERLVIGRGVLIMVFDPLSIVKWSGKDTSEGNSPGQDGQPLSPGDSVVVYDATTATVASREDHLLTRWKASQTQANCSSMT
ncbi:hypothetical protein MY10362_006863 [Beauveria mimosiformis]